MLPAAQQTSQSSKRHLGFVVELLDRLISWQGNSALERNLPNEVGALTGQPLAKDAEKPASAMLGFQVLLPFLPRRRAQLFSEAEVH